MSDNIIALVVPLVMIAIIFVWAPLLNFICPPCRHSSGWRRFQDAASKTQPPLLFRARINPAELGLHRRESDHRALEKPAATRFG
jgi:hypothetical protein